jgi:hypothetical protein
MRADHEDARVHAEPERRFPQRDRAAFLPEQRSRQQRTGRENRDDTPAERREPRAEN